MRLIDADALEKRLLEKGFYPAIVKRAIEDAPVMDAAEIQAKVRELGVEEWYQPEYLCRNCGGKIMACDAEDQIAVPKRCPICEAKLELEDNTPTSCDECSGASKLYRSCADCPRYKKMKKNGKED
nr:MAG TPA: DNA-directed RNA polymerase [Caudoviricetes sp.]